MKPPNAGSVDEDRPDVAIDARVDEERSEDLRAILDADGERAGEVGDVGVALDPVRAATIAANGPLTVREHLGGRHKPQSSVAEERRRRRTRLLAVRSTRTVSGWRWTLPRGCP